MRVAQPGITLFVILTFVWMMAAGSESTPARVQVEGTASQPVKSAGEQAPTKVNATSGYRFRTVFGDNSFDRPVAVRHAGDGTNRLFVVEKQGRIYSLQPSGNTFRKRLFLDITNRVNAGGSEQGLLGLAFHPDFKRNGLFYVNYTSYQEQTVIAAYRATAGLNGTAARTGEQVILKFAQPYSNHNGGDLAFGKDGFLYIASGDGGSAGDPHNYSQNLRSLLGKILRIDVRPQTVNGKLQPYRVPPGNPFVKRGGGVRPEIFAYGLRNPWRISFDRVTGELWTGDVGQNQLEEINVVRAGGNYGWNVMEGTQCFAARQGSSGCQPSKYIKPIFEYTHKAGGKSVTGGYVYRGTEISGLRGKYVFADFISGRIWTLQRSSNGAVRTTLHGRNIPLISSFGEDEKGELYVVTYNGALLRIAKN